MTPMYQIYWVMHLLGLFLAFLALGGLAAHAINGGGRETRARGLMASFHGLGLLLALVGGFGMQARGDWGWPGWIIVKFAVWVVLGAAYAVLLRKPATGRAWWFALPLLGGLALYMVNWKPF